MDSSGLTNQGFVELDRQFILVPDSSSCESAADESYDSYYSCHLEQTFSWDQLLDHPRVVVLGEPGSGKTTEFQHQAVRLNSLQQLSFFVRLDELVHDPFERVLGSIDWKRFEQWRDGVAVATFFLDSVDETKIGRIGDFYLALRRFRDALPADFVPRTKMFLSTRISDWQPETDGKEARNSLGLPVHADYTLTNGSLDFATVHIAPLDRNQVSTFLKAKGLKIPWEFYKALYSARAMDFIKRPLDALAVFELWKSQGRIGSLTELIESDIRTKLHERSSRAHDPLSPLATRAGAESLAAASVFCQRSSFKVRDDDSTAEALDGRLSVPLMWTDDEYATLLSRPIFDCASRGCVRFHHRMTREYLAACWVALRMRDGCPLLELEHILFAHVGRKRVIRRSLAPVAAWLAAGNERWNEHLRQWILDAAPGIHLQFGDPASLPTAYKLAVLEALIDSSASGSTFEFSADSSALASFADPSMEPVVAASIQNNSLPVHLRVELLGLARHGMFAECIDIAFRLVASVTEPVVIRVAATEFIASFRQPASLKQLKGIALSLSEAPEQLCAALVSALTIDPMSPRELWELLLKTKLTETSASTSHFNLSASIRMLPKGHAEALLHCISDFMQQHFPVNLLRPEDLASDVVQVVLAVLRPVLLVVFDQEALSEHLMDTIVVMMRLARWMAVRTPMDLREIGEATERHGALRQRLFWDFLDRRYAAEGLEGAARGIRLMMPMPRDQDADVDDAMSIAYQFTQYFGSSENSECPFTLCAGDIAWLEAGREKTGPLDEIVVWSIKKEMREYRHAQVSAETARNLRAQRLRDREIRLHLTKYDGRSLSMKTIAKRVAHTLLDWNESIKAHSFLYWYVCRAAIGSHSDVLSLPQNFPQGGFLGRRTQQILAERYSTWVTSRLAPARKAVLVQWRRFAPRVGRSGDDHAMPDVAVMIANAGIEFTLDQSSFLPGVLSDIDLKAMTECAVVYPHWRFPAWFAKLARNFPDHVDKTLAECLESVWPFDSKRTDCLEKLTEFTVGTRVQRVLIEKLAASSCRSEDAPQVLGILCKCDQLPTDELSQLARQNLELLSGDVKLRGMWLATWLTINADDAIQYWENSLADRADAALLVSYTQMELLNRIRWGGKQRFWSAAQLRRMILLTFPHVSTSAKKTRYLDAGACDKLDEELRESNALEFHDTLWQLLAADPTPEASEMLDTFIFDDRFERVRTRTIRLYNNQLARRAEMPPWGPADVRQFEIRYEVDPHNDYDLFKIAIGRLIDIKNDVEQSDTGLRTHLRHGDPERSLRIWLAHELTLRASSRYVVSQEAVIDREQRPDLTLQNPEAGSIWIEIKWAHTWSFTELREGLETQLLGKYLRGHRSSCGIYVLATFEQRGWRPGNREPELRFDELVERLQQRAETLVGAGTLPVKRLTVIGISFVA